MNAENHTCLHVCCCRSSSATMPHDDTCGTPMHTLTHTNVSTSQYRTRCDSYATHTTMIVSVDYRDGSY